MIISVHNIPPGDEESMKVLIAVHGFPPTHSAGAEQAAERIASWLASNHHETHVFALEKYDSQSVETKTDYYKGVVCYRLSYNIQDAGYGSNLRYDNPLVGSHFRDILEQGDFDIVHIVSGYLLGGQTVFRLRTLVGRVFRVHTV